MTLPPPANGSATSVTVWLSEHQFPDYHGQPFLDTMRAIARDFEAVHAGCHILIEGYDHQALPRAVADAVAQGRGPDIAEYYASSEQLARDTCSPDGRRYFTSVSRAMGDRREVLGEPVVLDDLEEPIRRFFTYRDELMSVPATATTPLLFANVTLLRRAGVQRLPRTWRELQAACRAVVDMPGGPEHGATWPNHGWLFQLALAQQAGLLADNDNGRTGRATTVNLASDPMLAWVDWWRELHTQGLYVGAEHWGVAYELFAEQKVAFTLSTSKLTYDFHLAAQEAGFEVAEAAPPHNDDIGLCGTIVSGHSLWLADGLDDAKRDAALAFTQFMINPANAARWHRAAGFIPVTRSAFDLLEEQGWFREHPYQRAATSSLRASPASMTGTGALLGDFAGIQEEMTRAMDDVLHKAADPYCRFLLATREAQRLLDAHNRCRDGERPCTPQQLGVH
ncbi:extracellular solute-binding protein [Micromonospora sediminicola]|uniref:extracellular solute-binding protein n=1 Tax=Micromonospora sediminicola TaxID=946078 RepID=UPI0033F0248A